ncbi:hypothetical protein COW36_23050 [bacterium (Candidatus Blackallbacteria) CG17_big_fil_post_rev_8_21_14_2_50_48_46]|uniref:Ankyrin repeat domain-containing protein n=1 Tax=bacterium (Candidatus Blackallbacteria) CG17_big_fil_post_rev_8_21_14_2_50_48_46 TaxID=2014261 RepID=A0A2M7FZ85_9BACT|nr:MAG: hypothetical protein COW64_16120 [bacterium (Candidatus Blackallbacteria) CG18_big_fil_WC_8_21_14_2_50_49_26]PIW14129.1 MAG: hypothetical protein COW36_23050 [bacterium (Candidatus Blackallbacteria) CG17_big_fil_post_rev_8_21_14_2_50_48_46]PIW45859.1 MAG: hypothetical protein COW20_18715 [bacterium (Candidatus Blackallbacteria) CG13_big_fil_rev_8_21_14_2_50_49_14]
MTWPPEVHLENSLDQQVYQALLEGNIAEIVNLDKQGIDWKKLVFPPLYISKIHRQTPIGDWLASFFSSRFPESDPKTKVYSYKFFYNFSDFCLLDKACDENDSKLLQEYFCLNSQWHKVYFDPIYYAILFNHFEIADGLINHGTNVKRWPRLLWELFMREYDRFCDDDYHCGFLSPRKESVLYTIKAGAELNYYDSSTSYFRKTGTGTVLDFAREIEFEPIVTALLEAGAKTVAELMQEQLYCPLPFDPATAQGIPFAG